MCKIFTVINKNPKNKALINRIIQANLGEISSEKDGYAVYNGQSNFYLGQPAYENIESNLIYNNEPIFIIHSRTKTTGSDDIDGLHLQEINGYVFAHNGTVGKYSTVLKKSDSYYFFKHFLRLYKKITLEAVEKWTKKADFSGKGLLYNKSTDELYYFCNQPSQVLILKDALIITSYEPETTEKIFKVNKILGFKWYSESEEKEIKGILHQEQIDDIYLHFKAGKCKEQTAIKTREIGVYNSYTPYKPYGDDDNKLSLEDLRKEGYTDEEIKAITNPDQDEDIRENDIKNQLTVFH
jgi:predicted glutamine amidotransferase